MSGFSSDSAFSAPPRFFRSNRGGAEDPESGGGGT